MPPWLLDVVRPQSSGLNGSWGLRESSLTCPRIWELIDLESDKHAQMVVFDIISSEVGVISHEGINDISTEER